LSFGINGTCGNCKSRFRFEAEEVISLDKIFCPHCGCDFGEEGYKRIILYARLVLNAPLKDNGNETKYFK